MNIILLNPAGQTRRFYADMDRRGKEFVMTDRLSAKLINGPACIIVAPAKSAAEISRIKTILDRTNIEHFIIALKDEKECTSPENSSALCVRILRAGADRCPENSVSTITPAELIECIDGIERFSKHLSGKSIFDSFQNSVLKYTPQSQSLSITDHNQPFPLSTHNAKLLRYLFSNAGKLCGRDDIKHALLADNAKRSKNHSDALIQLRMYEIRKTINEALDNARDASPDHKERLEGITAKNILRGKRGQGYGVFDPFPAPPEAQ